MTPFYRPNLHDAKMWWWGLGNVFPSSQADQLRDRKKLLARELDQKKLDIKRQGFRLWSNRKIIPPPKKKIYIYKILFPESNSTIYSLSTYNLLYRSPFFPTFRCFSFSSFVIFFFPSVLWIRYFISDTDPALQLISCPYVNLGSSMYAFLDQRNLFRFISKKI
jgi:hypothetical protein